MSDYIFFFCILYVIVSLKVCTMGGGGGGGDVIM